MTRYKKEAPSVYSEKNTIENYLAEIIYQTDYIMSLYQTDYIMSQPEIIDAVRRAWDLVPDESYEHRTDNEQRKSVMDHTEALKNKDAFHA